jgi:hypothetical protein
VLFCDEGAGTAARLAAHARLGVEVRSVEGAESIEAGPDPLPIVLPGPDDAEVAPLLEVLAGHGLEVVLEAGQWRGECLGLEVARVVRWPIETGGDGLLHIEAGVGRFDRDAAAAMHRGETPVDGLRRAIRLVTSHRHPDAPPHALSRLARSRWLRAAAVGDPARVGAATLRPAESPFPAGSVGEDAPAVAVGTASDGRDLLVVFAASGLLGLPLVAADARALHRPDAVLRLAVAEGSRVAALDELAAGLVQPAEVVEVGRGWA